MAYFALSTCSSSADWRRVSVAHSHFGAKGGVAGTTRAARRPAGMVGCIFLVRAVVLGAVERDLPRTALLVFFGAALTLFPATTGLCPLCRDKSFSSSLRDNLEYPCRPWDRARARSSLRFLPEVSSFTDEDLV